MAATLGFIAMAVLAQTFDAANDAPLNPSTENEASGCGCGSDALSRASVGDSKPNDGECANPAQRALGEKGESPTDANLIDIDDGCFRMGSDRGLFPEDGEGPSFEVCLSPYRIGKYEVSAARFAKFVEATGYKTESETFGNSFVVEQFVSEEIQKNIKSAVAAAPWWLPVEGASWKHPLGPDTNLTGLMNHPATHISWNDALKFCQWSTEGGRLPTEAEWEYAARGGKENRLFPWGNRPSPKRGKHRINIWQTSWPNEEALNAWRDTRHPQHGVKLSHQMYSGYPNTAADGYKSTAPVDAYEPNKFGLYNTVGNVWEWTNDWWTNDRSGYPNKDPQGPKSGTDKTKKGGSFMCNKFTCFRYRNAARMHATPDSGALNIGFRCAADALGPAKDTDNEK